MFIANLVDDKPDAMPIAELTPPPGAGAPPAPVHNGPAHWIKVSAQSDGSFTVTNARNGFSKSYSRNRCQRFACGARSCGAKRSHRFDRGSLRKDIRGSSF